MAELWIVNSSSLGVSFESGSQNPQLGGHTPTIIRLLPIYLDRMWQNMFFYPASVRLAPGSVALRVPVTAENSFFGVYGRLRGWRRRPLWR